MNHPVALVFAVLASTLLALSIAPSLGVCVAEGDPLAGIVPTCN